MSTYPPPFPFIDTVIEAIAVLAVLCIPLLLFLHYLELRAATRSPPAARMAVKHTGGA
jgi:hypothetical protein